MAAVVASLLALQVHAQPTSQRCSADADVCEQTCAGIGLYATLRRDAEAGRKMEKCNSHCAAEKAKCERSVASAAEPRANPPASPAPPSAPNSPSISGGAGAGVGIPAGSSLGNPGCPVEDVQAFQDMGTVYGTCRAGECISYKPLDCVAVEWRTKAKVSDRRESGLEARVVNRCPCRIVYSHIGTLRGYSGFDSGTEHLPPSLTTRWHAALREDRKFEVVPGTSCHYTDELMATYSRDNKRCVARRCASTGKYGTCGSATAK